MNADGIITGIWYYFRSSLPGQVGTRYDGHPYSGNHYRLHMRPGFKLVNSRNLERLSESAWEQYSDY